MPQITVTKANKQIGTPFNFDAAKDPVISIGRHPANDIVLNDPNRKVSRQHAAIILDTDDRYYIQDLGSMNGIRVNGSTVYCAVLMEGDSIRIGNYFLKFSYEHTTQRRMLVPIIADAQELSEATVLMEEFLDGPTKAHVNTSVLLARMPEKKQVIFQDIAKRLQLEADRPKILQDILDSCAHATDSVKGYIALMDDEGSLWISTTFGIDMERGEAVPGLAQTWIDHVTDKNTAYTVENFNGSGLALVCHPIHRGEELVGILYICRMNTPYSEEDTSFLQIVTEQARTTLKTKETSPLAEEKNEYLGHFEWKAQLIGNRLTPSMQEVYKAIEMLAPQDISILILGETGSGKEVVAHLLHKRSHRSEGPFMPFELSALPSEDMAASELFGHVEGAFTGATAEKRGKFEMAHNGTLFLDEIGDISQDTQAKLRRAIENKEVAKIGEEKTVQVDIRIISATNKDLRESIENGEFRADLFERLGSVIELPPLRERKEDIPVLIHYFIACCQTQVRGISPKALQLLLTYDWPRNVRELKNVIEEAVARAKGKEMLYPWDLPERFQADDESPNGRQKVTLKEQEESQIRDVLDQTGFNIAKSAEILGVSRQTLYNKMKAFGIEKPK